ncbi:MAG: hydantoinase/oxoprolinase family protein [Gammaproteobacteria bacterium]|nr:hydantoinase/oxoprolinase family protein [Gammaproteobacteria bacterium]
MADIHTIGAGGGSIAYVDVAGMLRVGPQSAGADPGPACYGRGGKQVTVSDANLVLGYLPDVALGGQWRLDRAAALAAMADLADSLGLSVVATAQGIIEIANEHMAQALRVISIERGDDPRTFSLLCYGGAGGLHVCAIAEALGVPRVIVPAHAGVFSALGMLIARPSRQLLRTVNLTLSPDAAPSIDDALAELEATGRRELQGEGHDAARIEARRELDLRYRGQSFTLTVPWTNPAESAQQFHLRHEARYGHALGVEIEVVNVRVGVSVPVAPLQSDSYRSVDAPHRSSGAHVEGLGQVVVMARQSLGAGSAVRGPSIITDIDSTTFVAKGWSGTIDRFDNLVLTPPG